MSEDSTETDESTDRDGAERAGESAPSAAGSEPRECPACGDTFEGDAAYRDHLFSVGLVY